METKNISQVVESNEKLLNLTLDVLNKFELAWHVKTENLYSENNLKTGSVGVFRADNDLWLATHSSRYVPMQNHELVKTLIYASSGIDDLKIEDIKGGNFGNGRKIYLQIPLPSAEIGNANVVRHLTAINSHDGTTGVALGSTQKVVSCQNTFFAVYRSTDMTKIKHNSNMLEKVNAIAKDLQMAINNDVKVIESFKKMYDSEFSTKDIEFLIKSISKIQNPMGEKKSELTKRRQTIISEFNNCMELELSKEGENVWGLFNAVTRYTNHRMKRNLSDLNEQNKMNNILLGDGYRINKIAYNYLNEKYIQQ